ncbi:CBS domain-containing protein, partial [Streptomyces xanthochromogenes]
MPASQYTVSDVMTHTAVAVGRKASYKEIVEVLHQWKVSALPVLEREGRVALAYRGGGPCRCRGAAAR